MDCAVPVRHAEKLTRHHASPPGAAVKVEPRCCAPWPRWSWFYRCRVVSRAVIGELREGLCFVSEFAKVKPRQRSAQPRTVPGTLPPVLTISCSTGSTLPRWR